MGGMYPFPKLTPSGNGVETPDAPFGKAAFHSGEPTYFISRIPPRVFEPAM